MKKKFLKLFSIFFFSLFALKGFAECTLEVEMSGPIGSGSLDLLERAQARADESQCQSLLLLINTPGGSVDSTRRIVSEILNSKRPVLCLVYPDGAHAGSAGAIILQACHVNGAMSGTNLGAATPILGDGQSMSEDLRKKMVNDMTSWMDSLTSMRKRDQSFGRDIILEAKAVAAEEAHKIGAIDFVVKSKQEFLNLAQGRSVLMTEGKKQDVIVGDLVTFALDFRFQLLSLLSDPQIAYLLFLGGLALLYFEFTHPGTLIAGVTGGLCLILALIALHKLNVEWGGLLLILLGVALLIAEMFVPSFGALGIGGMVAFVVGSVFLFDPVKTGGYTLPLSTILITALFFGGLFLGIGYLVLQTFRIKRREGVDEFFGEVGEVLKVTRQGRSGFIEIKGENWAFESEGSVDLGDRVKVIGHKGLKLKVMKESKGD